MMMMLIIMMIMIIIMVMTKITRWTIRELKKKRQKKYGITPGPGSGEFENTHQFTKLSSPSWKFLFHNALRS